MDGLRAGVEHGVVEGAAVLLRAEDTGLGLGEEGPNTLGGSEGSLAM